MRTYTGIIEILAVTFLLPIFVKTFSVIKRGISLKPGFVKKKKVPL